MLIDISAVNEQLNSNGIAYLHGYHTEKDFAAICDYLGGTISTLDVKQDKSRSELVFGTQPIDFHTDSPAADLIAWLCVNQDECATLGAMEFVDTFPISEHFSPKVLSILSNIKLQRRIKNTSQIETSYIVKLEEGKINIFYAPWLLPKNLGSEEENAIECLKQFINSSKRTSIRMNPGDVVIIDNRRVLHGRAAISEQTTRHLMRAWIRRLP
jgi:Taurine catabolism dioxygenase TauD, TfdA family